MTSFLQHDDCDVCFFSQDTSIHSSGDILFILCVTGNRLGKLVRTAEIEKIPYTAVIGLKERDTSTISLRGRKSVDFGSLATEEVLERLKSAIEENREFE